MVFEQHYARQYDEFYLNKDYTKECDWLESLFHHFEHTPSSVLDLGCGTGSHDVILCQRGYKVTGVDRSPYMLTEARTKAERQNCIIRFIEADIGAFQPIDGQKFDSVISMFAVMGYQTANESLEKAFLTARRCLKEGGLFIFDCWQGSAVIRKGPESRVHRYSSAKGVTTYRLVTPDIDHFTHQVRVNYQILELDDKTVLSESHETHLIRFFFPQEIVYFLKKTGFDHVHFFPFGEICSTLDQDCWNMCVVAY